uniref:Uncharacterized protein n=1 Tax=Myotis myotis TaxID=51298 RepID=A0A7J7VIJ3_MYOMY|nr:hypothetical protein mMyoMyo1_008382 [Myotis myotis]
MKKAILYVLEIGISLKERNRENPTARVLARRQELSQGECTGLWARPSVWAQLWRAKRRAPCDRPVSTSRGAGGQGRGERPKVPSLSCHKWSQLRRSECRIWEGRKARHINELLFFFLEGGGGREI